MQAHIIEHINNVEEEIAPSICCFNPNVEILTDQYLQIFQSNLELLQKQWGIEITMQGISVGLGLAARALLRRLAPKILQSIVAVSGIGTTILVGDAIITI